MRDLILGSDIATQTLIYVPKVHRYRHVYVLGKSGAGKSALLHRCITQDAKRQHATVLFDAGDLANHLVETLPGDILRERVRYFSVDLPISYNPLVRRREDPGRLESEIFSLLDQVTAEGSSTAPLSARMKRLLSLAMRRVLTAETEPTFATLTTHLLEQKLELQWMMDLDRESFTLTHEAVIDRLNQFLRDPRVRRIVCQPNALNWDEIINHRLILLVSLTGLDVPMIRFVGTLLFNGLMHTVLERPEHKRRPVAVYIDEFHNYVASGYAVHNFQRLFKEGRRHLMALTIAHQDFGGLDRDLLRSIHGNVNNVIAFSCGTGEAESMSGIFGGAFPASTIQFLPDWEAIARVGNFERSTTIHRFQTYPAPRKKRAIKHDEVHYTGPDPEDPLEAFAHRHAERHATAKPRTPRRRKTIPTKA